MKKLLLITLFMILSFSLMSCKKSTKTTSKSSESTTTTLKKLKSNLFDSISIPDKILLNETSIFTLNETVEGFIKENYNPYKTSSLEIDSLFFAPSGKEYFRPAYWTQDYDLSLNTLIKKDTVTFDDEIEGQDIAKKVGIEHFNISYKPLEVGKHEYLIAIYTNGILSETIKGEIEVLDNAKDYKGKVTINDTNRRYFMYENTKETFIPVGLNNAWYTSSYRKSYDYDEWFKRMKENSINMSRIWMASWSFGLHIGTGSAPDDFTQRLNQASRLERVIKLAEDNGIYLYLTLNNHGQFSTTTNPEWDINSYNTLIEKPYYFWNTDSVKRTYRDELRYIIGRYGTYDSILAYELFNEVDWSDMSSLYQDKIKSWHKEMSEYINKIDSYDRLVTTSYIYDTGSAYALNSIDIANIHSYDFTTGDVFTKVKEHINTSYNAYNKLVMFSEWGVNADTVVKTYNIDPDGISLYQSLWAGVLEGAAGTTMCWWWESYVHPNNLYTLYKGIGEFTKEMDLNGEISYLNKDSIKVDSALNAYGIKADNRYYLYLYDKNYSRTNTKVNSFTTNLELNVFNKEYSITIMNPRTGEIVKNDNITVTDSKLIYNVSSFDTDIAIIIK